MKIGTLVWQGEMEVILLLEVDIVMIMVLSNQLFWSKLPNSIKQHLTIITNVMWQNYTFVYLEQWNLTIKVLDKRPKQPGDPISDIHLLYFTIT